MKKTILLFVMALAFSLTNAQEKEISVAAYQNLDSDFADVLVEMKITDTKNINYVVGTTLSRGVDKTVYGGIGYSLKDKNINLTPSIIVGTGFSDNLFYGFDGNLDININKWLSIGGKLRYIKEDAKEFAPNYYAGLKIRL